MKAVSIPSPLPYLAQIPDSREYLKTHHRWQDLLLICLIAVGAGRHNILAISQWVKDHRAFLLNQVGIRTRLGQRKLPAQATLYRFFQSLSEQLDSLQAALLGWAQEVWQALGQKGPLPVAADGKHLRGTRRIRQGEEALVFLSALVQGLGLSLGSQAVSAGEAAAAQGLVVRMEGLGVDWVLTGDAALCNPELAAAVVERKGGICSASKRTRRSSRN
ncbi:transposase family protein [Meiothermus sp. CFH 77666]|uniref:transposase family protein n=1 Tax=Meiothermus sp. CFH 77666 TaxID=2817942 RepID=UPI001FB09D91|nr:transposase family protein [Meiothermus sp. CFH 77666]